MCKMDGCDSPVLSKGMCSKHYQVEWRRANRNKTKEYNDRSRAKNPEGARESARKYRQAHLEETREKCRQYSRSHRSERREYDARYGKLHPEVRRAKKIRRRLRLSESMTAADKKDSLNRRREIRDNPCFYCGRKEGVMHDDHMLPLGRGGTDHVSNLVRACPSCNLSKGSMTADEFMESRRVVDLNG